MQRPRVIHRDEDLLVVCKPPGLPTTSPSDGPCLVRWVEETFPDLRGHPTSRLDSAVTGLVTFALTKAANQRLLQARRNGTYGRVYFGITLRPLEPQQGVWTWPISIDPGNRKLRIAGSGRGERDARTRYEVAAKAPHGSMLRLIPETGRTHQLRVHAARADAPLFGDHAYGGERRVALPDGAVVTAPRVMLHCAEIALPWGSDVRRFEAPLPKDMRSTWHALGGLALSDRSTRARKPDA